MLSLGERWMGVVEWGQNISKTLGAGAFVIAVWAAAPVLVTAESIPKTLSVPDTVAAALPSVVSIMSHGTRVAPFQPFPSGSGSGIILAPGYILTFNHLVTS